MLEVLEQENSFIDSTTMRRVYETLKTPYKYGAVIKEKNRLPIVRLCSGIIINIA